MALDKINFQNGTIVRSNFLNEIQKGTSFTGSSRADYYSDPTTSEENSWGIGQRDGLKDWELDPRFGLGAVAASGRINAWSAIANTTPTQYQGVTGLPAVLMYNPTTGAASTDPYISINQGSFVDQNGVKRQWSTTNLAIRNNQTNYIYYRYNSGTSSWGFTYSLDGFPSSETLHVPIAKITVVNGSIPVDPNTNSIFFDGGFVDYRQGSYSGYLNSYSSQLVNTDIKVSNYQAKNLDRVLCDTSAGSFIVTLPQAPEDGTRVAISDIYGTFDQFPIVIKAYESELNGVYTPIYTINGSSDNWIINTKNSYLALFYSDLTNDWRFEDLPLDSANAKLGEFLSCGGREIIPNLVSATSCPTGTNIPASYPDPSLGTYFWDSVQQVCYAEIRNTTALYGDGTASGTIKEFNSKRCTTEDIEVNLNANKRNIIYVDPVIGNDSIANDGDISTPFRTIERAILEGVRRSYRRGSENDIIDSIAIQLAPGDYYIDNRPYNANINDITTLSTSSTGLIAQEPISNTNIIQAYSSSTGYFIAELPANSSQNLVAFGIQIGRVIYSSSGGVGTIFRMQQVGSNSTQWRVYIQNVSGTFSANDSLSYDQLYKFNPTTGGLIVPRGISINGVELRKVRIRPMYVPSISSGVKTAIFKVTGNTYISQMTFADNKQFNFSHSSITAVEYASKCELVALGAQRPDGTSGSCSGELAYYAKVTKLFKDIDGYPTTESQEGRLDEWSIVTTSVLSRETRFTDNIINLTGEDYLYNDQNQSTNISDLITSPTNVPGPAIDSNDAFLNLALPDVNSARSSSPYVFNCSVRSIYGMNGMHADGYKIEGLRSMVVAQFTQVSLQVDPRAFDGPYLPNTPSADRSKQFKEEYRHFGFKASNDAYIQIVSCFVIGNADHFISQSGGDLSITNSCSDFGDVSLKAIGYKAVAFSQDKRTFDVNNPLEGTHISEIIPPKPLSGTYVFTPETTQTGNITTGLTIDRALTFSAGNTGRVYLSANYNNKTRPPSTSTLAGSNKYSYTRENGTLLSGPTEYQKIFIAGKTPPRNINSVVNSVVNSSQTTFSSNYSTNFMGFIKQARTGGAQDNTTSIFTVNNTVGITAPSTSNPTNNTRVYIVNNETATTALVTSVNTTTKVVGIDGNLSAIPGDGTKIYFYKNRTGSELAVRPTSAALEAAASPNQATRTKISFADVSGICIGDMVYGPTFTNGPLPVLDVRESGDGGWIEIAGLYSSFTIPSGTQLFIGVRQERSTIPLTIKTLDANNVDSDLSTNSRFAQFDVRVELEKSGDRQTFRINSVTFRSSGVGFKVSSFSTTLNITGNILDTYPGSDFGAGSGADITNYIFNEGDIPDEFIGSPGYIEGAVLVANVTIDPGVDEIYFANLLPPINGSGVNYYEVNTGEFSTEINATKPDVKSRVFGWDNTNSRWYFRVEEPGPTTNTIWTAINSAPNTTTNPLISNNTSITLRRKVDRRSADQRVYRVKVRGFKDSVRKPLAGYIVQSQSSDWVTGDQSKAFIIANVQDTNEDGITLNNAENIGRGLTSNNYGEYILTLVKLSDAQAVITRDYYPDVDYDNPTADPASIASSAISEFITYNIRNADQSVITLAPALSSFAIKRYFAPSTYQQVYCELRRPSLIRATNHTWEWVGYLNYDTALPALQGSAWDAITKARKIITEVNGGRVYATGMDEDGIFRIGSFAYDLKTNKQFDTSIPDNIVETGRGTGSNLSVQLNGTSLSDNVNTLNFTGDGSVIVDGSIANITLSGLNEEIPGSRIINGTVTPNKLSVAYVQKNGDTMLGKLFGTDFEASGIMQANTLKFGATFSNTIGTNSVGNRTVSSSAPTAAGSQGDIWYVI